ncbi:MAG: hypothetical protein HKN17_11320, partial [Rhodothermales bacterium]|nr:hypothetical protein [Rhodothermales bacterium]
MTTRLCGIRALHRFSVLVALAVSLSVALPAAAQETHTIRIQNGLVFVDDERVPAEELPESLDVDNVSASFSFTGGDRAFFDLGGHVYMLREGRLSEVQADRTNDGLVVFFAADGEHGPVRFEWRNDGTTGVFNLRSRGDETYAFYGDALFDQARKMEELRDRLTTQKASSLRSGEIEGTVLELTDAANNTARMAEALPRIQFQAYLESIGDRDAALFEQLQREHQLEMN